MVDPLSGGASVGREVHKRGASFFDKMERLRTGIGHLGAGIYSQLFRIDRRIQGKTEEKRKSEISQKEIKGIVEFRRPGMG